MQLDETISSTEMTEKRMPAPGTKDAPKFRGSQPAELGRFIKRMEGLWKLANITDAKEKKEMLGDYADTESEDQWRSLDNFKLGSWEAFRDELIETYPEAAEAKRGTPARIRILCLETPKIKLGDLSALYQFRRAFLAEARKLKVYPPAMGNRELVELFIGCLSESMASAVFLYLGNQISSSDSKKEIKDKTADSTTADSTQVTETETDTDKAKESKGKERRPEDQYELDDVCKAAVQVSKNSLSMFGLLKRESSSRQDRDVYTFSQPVSETKNLSDKMEELEGVQALEKDRMVNLNKSLESKISGLENLIKTLMVQGQGQPCRGDCKGTNCKMHEASTNIMQKNGKSLENERCFWCGLFGHFQADCEDLKNQIRLGNVKINHEGKLRLKDGSFIPRFPAEASLKERVERHYSRKPSQLYYGEYEDNNPVNSTNTSIFSQLLNSNNEADKRSLAQLKVELDLRKREEALELKQKLMEQNEKKLEHANGTSRAVTLLELLEQLTDEELAAIKSAKSGFN